MEVTYYEYSNVPVWMWVFWLLCCIAFFTGLWRLFEKAGYPGWAALVPFYNIYIAIHIGGKPGWWLLLLFVPIVNIVIAIILINAIAVSFGKNEWYTVGLIFLWFIFWPLLGLGSSRYIGPGGAGVDMDEVNSIGRGY